ncbi:hypothetical protein, partial [Proteus mirabilis]|uniref:hypothetical protein n=1 Tax=Proteus mirabilis TaxID=584 RepID=UPI001C132A06
QVLPEPENFALFTKGSDSNDRRKKPFCEHCKKLWHTKENCWKLQGKPPNVKKKIEGKGFTTTATETTHEQTLDSWTPQFTKEQLEHLY